jgi:hypothetical protein
VYRLVKKAYGRRSKIVHGSSLTEADEVKNIQTRKQLDELLRSILKDNILNKHSIFYMKQDKLDEYFINLTLGNGRSEGSRETPQLGV